jgi:hypothetical protein
MYVEEHEAIHTWFSLSYANYLVLPRAVLQSMPDEWQQRFVACLDEMHELFGHLDWPVYEVKVLLRPARVVDPAISCEVCNGRGHDERSKDCAECDGVGEVSTNEGLRYETGEEVGYRDDPIPHYSRGRTRLQPRC